MLHGSGGRMEKKWWKEAVVYQIYPASFQDTDGDGTGDLKGITRRLGYLEELGVNVLWLCPVNQSPMRDMGYDISDYYKVNPLFGTGEDLDDLIAEAGKRGMKVLLDLVVNHCSNEHEWFRKALADPSSPYRDYFFFVSTPDGKEPNNFRSYTGGSVWERAGESNEFYFHAFAPGQPDLNWDCPRLRDEIVAMMEYWCRKGVAGFRVDAIGNLKKAPEVLQRGSFPADGPDGRAFLEPHIVLQPGIEDYLGELRDRVFRKYDSMTVAECTVPEDKVEEYLGEDGLFSMAFDFTYIDIDIEVGKGGDRLKPWTIGDFKVKLYESQRYVQAHGWGTVFMENHDLQRSVSKFSAMTPEAVKALAALWFFLRGTPYIYQGQELGMANYPYTSPSQIRDPFALARYENAEENGETKESVFSYLKARGRDNCRTPMQWDSTENAGFSSVEPWIPVNPDYKEKNAEREVNDPGSVFSFYKEMIRLRLRSEHMPVLVYGDFRPVETEDSLFCYQRSYGGKTLTVAVNYSDREAEIPAAVNTSRVILNSLSSLGPRLQAYQAVVTEG